MKKFKYIYFLCLWFLLILPVDASFLGSSGSDTVWQMKTYYETVELNATQVKILRNELEKMRLIIEQISNLPEEILKSELYQYTGMINDLVAIQNEVKMLLADARDFETYLGQVYNDVRNADYISMLDRYANTITDLSANAMKQSAYYQSSAQKSVNSNATYLKRQAQSGNNPIQLLQTLNSWNSNLSFQISTITDMINNNNRIQAIDYLEKANKIKIDQEQTNRMNLILDKRIQEMKQRQTIKK